MTEQPRPRLAALAAVVIAAAALTFASCGDDSSSRDDEARQVVSDVIAAFAERDFETVCELSSARINEAIPELVDEKTCPQGYDAIFESGLRGDFERFIDRAQRYEPGDVKEIPERTRVTLNGPNGQEAFSYLVEEDGELKVTDLFVVPGNVPGGAVPAPGG